MTLLWIGVGILYLLIGLVFAGIWDNPLYENRGDDIMCAILGWPLILILLAVVLIFTGSFAIGKYLKKRMGL